MSEELKKIKFSVRSLFIFEQLMDKVFELKNTSDLYAYYYSCLLAGKAYEKTFEEFLDEVDANPESIVWFIDELEKNNKLSNQFIREDDNIKKK